eukprot:CAMPEP_0201566878 /NCGR_PEP_ID=MMETSP0190_2-20130828/6992_1 /ASSEMBLY_ACC=CAM_ASM_000263 /TAXON_ID=37353 /ORGANISM="Rosalina sp." /LENGTH=554 /DNA_ID=CAMNT_0047986173 /DNA_START=392 /DNA_END=2056 /DNA_ORIENTATION=+
MYWYSDANQLARFKQYDENSCDQDWYDEPGVNAHSTCDWVKDEYGGGSHCDIFGGGCGFGTRAVAYSIEDGAWFDTEGICGANTCYTDGHCEPIFGNWVDYQGCGFVEGMNGASAVYSRATDEIYYNLYSGAHLDERMRIVEEDRRSDGKHFVLMAQYFDNNQQYGTADNVYKCYSLYDGAYHEMGVEVSVNFTGPSHKGINFENHTYSIDSYNVMVSSYHDPPINTCEPYAFLCQTKSGAFYRLPEDRNYFFGTEWMDWEWSNHAGNWDLQCKENHYHLDSTTNKWVVNGDPQLDRCDIWYYHDDDGYSECLGCPSIPKLECWEDCIRSNFDTTTCSACDSVTGTSYGNEWCTPSPTEAPTLPTTSPTSKPTSKPSRSPLPEGVTYAPTLPTEKPTRSPLPSPDTQTNAPTVYFDGGAPKEGGANAGVIVAVILIIILVCGGIALWAWWRIKNGVPVLPRAGSQRAKNDESQISRQITADNLAMQIQHQNGPSTDMGYDAPQIGMPPPSAPPSAPTDTIPNIGDDDSENAPLSGDEGGEAEGDNATGDYDLDI